jgi:acyl carrier protein phosphodiesterase
VNYLAHCYVSRHSEQGILGAMLGDFVKGPLVDRFDPAVRDAIRLHRQVDSFMDGHETNRRLRNRFSPRRRRFAGIVLDICYDHFLARHWSHFAEGRLSAFSARVFSVLEAHRDSLPERLREQLPHLVRHNPLLACRELASVERILDGVASRIRFPNQFRGSLEEVRVHYAALEAGFWKFLPDLMDRVEAK